MLAFFLTPKKKQCWSILWHEIKYWRSDRDSTIIQELCRMEHYLNNSSSRVVERIHVLTTKRKVTEPCHMPSTLLAAHCIDESLQVHQLDNWPPFDKDSNSTSGSGRGKDPVTIGWFWASNLILHNYFWAMRDSGSGMSTFSWSWIRPSALAWTHYYRPPRYLKKWRLLTGSLPECMQ